MTRVLRLLRYLARIKLLLRIGVISWIDISRRLSILLAITKNPHQRLFFFSHDFRSLQLGKQKRRQCIYRQLRHDTLELRSGQHVRSLQKLQLRPNRRQAPINLRWFRHFLLSSFVFYRLLGGCLVVEFYLIRKEKEAIGE